MSLGWAEEVSSGGAGPKIVASARPRPKWAVFGQPVAEKLFGIKLKGEKAVIAPSLAPNTPHIEFELGLGGKRLYVIADDGCSDGEWCIRMGRLVCNSNTVGKNMHSPITLFKNSCKLSKRVI